MLEAEVALARAWYQSRDDQAQDEEVPEYLREQRPEVPDTEQPCYSTINSREAADSQPELPWDDSPREFPFTSTCLLLGLLHDDGLNETRPGDIQLQPLDTVFRGTSLEYGMAVLDISNLDQVKYGIIAFPIRYMAEVYYRGEEFGWDPVEDDPPTEEPVAVAMEVRPRALLSILQNLKTFYYTVNLQNESHVLELEQKPLADGRVLEYLWPGKSTAGDDDLKQRVRSLGTADKPHNAQIDRAIDNLLILTQSNLSLDAWTISKFQKLAEFQSQLRRRLEETPDSLGPSEAAGHILRIAYSGHNSLHWVLFKNISYEAVAAAIMSDELRGAVVLSLCVDDLKGEFSVLRSAISRIPSLKHLCLLRDPDRENDDASDHLCRRLFELSRQDLLFRDKTVYLSSNFSTPLNRVQWLPSEDCLPLQVLPTIHVLARREGKVGDGESVQHTCHYLGDGLFGAERFAVGFLTYLQSIGSNREMLQFACGPPTLSTYESSPSAKRLAVSPIPAAACAIPKTDGEHIIMGAGSWVVIMDVGRYSHRTKRNVSPDAAIIRYAFLKANQTVRASGAFEPDTAATEAIEVVGGLGAFMREEVPGVDDTLVERLLGDAEDAVARRFQARPASNARSIDEMDETSARALFNRMLQNLDKSPPKTDV
ncbi:unnamed protein product [Clonostachys byssicola]|uniref:Uncharacterized protein n=1 Tax=Clonostachys byssicola TaxID=160290 RepID=A0A9N9Y1D1_9HYPO|nr:unnamed protein product [Clonostachys byssicola]